jgi:hypothetical protein
MMLQSMVYTSECAKETVENSPEKPRPDLPPAPPEPARFLHLGDRYGRR